jgi:hypothetical protein
MSLLDSVKDVLNQYASGSTQNDENASQHFDQVAQAADHNVIAEGLAAVFHSDQTPAFGNLVSNLFSQSNGDQKAGMLNQLLASVGPSTISQLAGGGALAALLGGGAKQVTADQAQNISPEVVQQLAVHAEKSDPSIVDKASAFYAQHPTLDCSRQGRGTAESSLRFSALCVDPGSRTSFLRSIPMGPQKQ